MKENVIKTCFAAALAGLSAYFGMMIIPLIVLALVMTTDYITGMTAAWMHCKVSSRKGSIGLVKKGCYLLVVVVGATVDWILKSALVQAGVDAPKTIFLFGLLVTIWLIINELISILENLDKIGVPLPGFLKSIVKKLKQTVEAKAEIKESE